MIQGAEAGGVELLAEDAMTFAQIDIVDHVTPHEVGMSEFGRVTVESGRQGQDVVFGDWHERMIFCQRERKWM